LTKKNARNQTAPSIAQTISTPLTATVAEDGKIRMSAEDFGKMFAKLIGGAVIPENHADPSTFKTNPVTPAIGSRVLGADVWFKRYIKSATDAAGDWEERTLTPRKDPITAAIAANEHRKDRLAQSEKDEKWLKTMQKRNFNDVAEGVQAVKAEGYSSGVTAKKAKAERRIKELQPLVETLAKTLDGLSTDTKKDRGEKMLAARDGMLTIGDKMRGITPSS